MKLSITDLYQKLFLIKLDSIKLVWRCQIFYKILIIRNANFLNCDQIRKVTKNDTIKFIFY